MTRAGCDLCREHVRYNEKRDAAYNLLLAYAECEKAWGTPEWHPTLRKNGWDEKGRGGAFTNSLRQRALAAAKEAE